mmetsp:Transcript_57490/g.133988  ORF Transcript_57490/g.133988 Transcript_57490/m.133988 type:complete len:450 (+) Transcript_57490:51-1400(+)
MAPEKISTAQQAALDALTAAQEGISVKSLIDFRRLTEVSSQAQDVASAAVCMVAGIDEGVEADEGVSPRTWEAARSVLAKPGHFINSLRRFPYAVDGGRLPAANLAFARERASAVSPEAMLAEQPVVQQLFQWLMAAWQYCDTAEPTSAEPEQPLQRNRTSLSPSSPASSRRPSARSQTVPTGSPRSTRSPTAGRSHERLSRVGVGGQRSPVRNVQEASVISTRSSQRTGASPSYLRGVRPGAEDHRLRVDQIKRETRQLKAQESELKWNMRREEDKQRRVEKKQDEQETMAWRQQQKMKMLARQAQLRKAEKKVVLEDSKSFQEHKRAQKQAAKDEELQNIHQAYVETVANSAKEVEAKTIAMAEWPKPAIEANLEKLRHLAEHKLEEQQREDIETAQVRAAAEQAELDHQLMLAKRERELALQSLEVVRSHRHSAVPQGRHLVARPK